jgi:transposase
MPDVWKKLYSPEKGDVEHARKLWCQNCKAWIDRDVVAALNLSVRGRSRFDRSLPQSEAGEEKSLATSYCLLHSCRGERAGR